MAKLLEKFLVLRLSKAVSNKSVETLDLPDEFEGTLSEVIGSVLGEIGLSGVVVEVEQDIDTQ